MIHIFWCYGLPYCDGGSSFEQPTKGNMACPCLCRMGADSILNKFQIDFQHRFPERCEWEIIEYIPLSDWYAKPGLITCNDDALTQTVWSTFHIEQTTDHILKLYTLLYCSPFLVGMTLISFAEIPRSHLGRCSSARTQHTPVPIMFENEGARDGFHPCLAFLWICFESDYLVPFYQTSFERMLAGKNFFITLFNVFHLGGLRRKYIGAFRATFVCQSSLLSLVQSWYSFFCP